MKNISNQSSTTIYYSITQYCVCVEMVLSMVICILVSWDEHREVFMLLQQLLKGTHLHYPVVIIHWNKEESWV